jgi:hypothetical protein
MKKFLIILGSIFLAIVVLIAVGIGYVAIRGTALDKESKAYADAAIPAIITNWNEKELLNRASPEFSKAVTPPQIDQLFRWFSSLGALRKYDPPQGQALMSATTQAGKQITAEYSTKATFEKGEATVILGLIKHDDQWQILRFKVNSPQLVPK